MKNKLSLILILIFTLSIFVSGCGEKTSKNDNTLYYAAESEYEKINPALDNTNTDDLIFRGLMKFDENNEPQKDIAEDYSISEQGLQYNFKIKKGIMFHDGIELKAEDVAFTINTVVDANSASSKSSEFKEVKTVEAISDYEIKITLKNKFPSLLDKLTLGIIPKHAFEGKDIKTAEFNQKPIGCGPYKFDSWEKGKSLTLKANKEFHGTKPSIETVVFKFLPDGNVRALQLQTGEVDIAFLEPSQVKNMEKIQDIKVYKVNSADYRCMMYNLNKEIWKDLRVRKAFNYAVNRKAVVDSILMGYGVEAYSPIQLNKYNNENVEKYSYDLTKAEVLLEEAGYKKAEDGMRYKDGKKLSFTITTPITDEVRVNIANYLASEFKKLGAEVKVDALDWSVIKIKDCESFILGWGSPFDADDHTYKLYHSSQIGGSGYNYSDYSDKDVDRLLLEARTIDDDAKRKELYGEFQKELADNPTYCYISYLQALYGVDKNIKGIKERTLGHHGAGFLWNIEEWTIDDK